MLSNPTTARNSPGHKMTKSDQPVGLKESTVFVMAGSYDSHLWLVRSYQILSVRKERLLTSQLFGMSCRLQIASWNKDESTVNFMCCCWCSGIVSVRTEIHNQTCFILKYKKQNNFVLLKILVIPCGSRVFC